MKRFPPLTVLLLLASALLIAAVAGCSKQSSMMTAPDTSTTTSVSSLKVGAPELKAAFAAQEANTPGLLRIEGVVGTATTLDDHGRPAILVLSEHALGAGRLPAAIGSYAVIEAVTGKIVAYKGHGGGTSHTAKQTPPIQLGTSGGNVNDIANGFCCSGTLGALVQKGGTQYILSNSHVFAGDVQSGGNGRVAQIGDDINQPGLVDNNCSSGNTNIVADLS